MLRIVSTVSRPTSTGLLGKVTVVASVLFSAIFPHVNWAFFVDFLPRSSDDHIDIGSSAGYHFDGRREGSDGTTGCETTYRHTCCS